MRVPNWVESALKEAYATGDSDDDDDDVDEEEEEEQKNRGGATAQNPSKARKDPPCWVRAPCKREKR